MTLTSPLQVPIDQFSELQQETGRRRPRPLQLLLTLPGVATALAVVLVGTKVTDPGWLLAATSILTGLTFNMAGEFWKRSIDARTDPRFAVRGDVLTTLDTAKTHMAWTVTVGVAVTGALILVTLFAPSAAPVWVTAVVGGLAIYQIVLVAAALYRFFDAAELLRP